MTAVGETRDALARERLRDRWGWMLALAARKLRDGPGPWLRAMRRGAFQLLPPRTQKLVLAFSGRRRLRSRTARVSPPAAAGEVPGLVSVVLPVYQQARFLAAAIDSVLAQSWPSLELIVLDDGSGPEVDAVLQSYAGDRRVRCLRQDNRGLPAALNTAFELACGEFWCWTSADNLMHPRQLEEMVRYLRAHSEASMVYADYELIDAHDRAVHGTDFRVAWRRGPADARVRLPRDTAALGVVQDNFIGPCFCYRGSAGRLLGPYEPEPGLEDYDFWLRLDRVFRIEHVGHDTPLYRYRLHGDTMTARASGQRLQRRAQELLARERRRTAWQAAPVQIAAPTSARAWLEPLLRPGESLVEPTGLGDTARKTLLVLDGDGLDGAAPALPATAAAAVWFDSPAAVHAAHHLLDADRVIAFAADPAVAARLAVYTRQGFHGRRDGAALELARSFTAERTFPERRATADRQAPMPVHGSPLRVLLHADSFDDGSRERAILDLATGLREHGVHVAVLPLRPTPRAAAELRKHGIDTLDAGPHPSDATLKRILREGAFDVVDAHDSPALAAAAAEAGVRCVQTLHDPTAWVAPEARAALRAADPHTSAYVATSAQLLAFADHCLGLDVGKAVIVPRGIALERPRTGRNGSAHPTRRGLGLAPDEFVFLQVGDLRPAAAQRAAVQALARVRGAEPRARLLCLGGAADADYAELVRAEAAALGVAQAITFVGHGADPSPFFGLADALLAPSWLGDGEHAVLGAIRAGLPLVVADIAAARPQLLAGHGVLVRAPIRSLAELDAVPADGAPADYAARLAEGMSAAMQRRRRRPPPITRLWAIDRRRMVADHLRLLLWLRQGGAPAAVRPWLWRSAGGR